MHTQWVTNLMNDLVIRKIGVDMNDELKALVLKAGAPKEMLNEFWFNIFCEKFADVLLTEAEKQVFGETCE